MFKKRIISVILTVVIIMTSCFAAFYAYAQSKVININVQLLDSLLNDRYWVIETLAGNNLSNNPYSVFGANYTGATMLDEVLENYQNDEAFSAVVDAMDIYANTGEYVSGFTDSVITTFMEWFGASDSEGALSSVNQIIASTDELKYESILNEVLLNDYTSSWGSTLFESDMELERLKQMSEVLSKLGAYQTALKDAVGLSGENSEVIVYDPTDSIQGSYEVSVEDYATNILDAYSQDLENYLSTVCEIPGLSGNEALQKKLFSTGALAAVCAYERIVLPESDYNLDDIFYEGMIEDTTAILGAAGSVLEISQKTIDTAILLESLQSQKDSTVATMTRLSENTFDADLRTVLNNYSSLVESQGNDLAFSYNVITNYLRNNTVVSDFIYESTENAVTGFVKSAAKKYAGAQGIALTNTVASALARVGAIVDIAVWVSDSATGIKETSKKVYECLYIQRLINEAVSCFNADLELYNSSKTEENAEKVLNDLEFIKKLRLYGETVAFGSMSAQMESWIGLLLGGGETLPTLEKRYQAMIDTYLGCTATPTSANSFSLGSEDIVTISTEYLNEEPVCLARVTRADGTSFTFAEADCRLMSGIDLNGGTLNIESAVNGFCLSSLYCSTDSVINIYSPEVAFGSVNTSDCTLTINLKNTTATFEIAEKIKNYGTLDINGADSSAIDVYNIYNYGSYDNINFNNVTVNVLSNVINNGNISGNLNFCGGNTQSYENGYFTYGRQVISGVGYLTSVSFNNTQTNGVAIDGTQYVSGSVFNESTRLHRSHNLILTDNCAVSGDYFKGDLGFSDYSTDNAITIDGSAYIQNTVAFNGNVILEDGLNLKSTCSALTLNGDTVVKGDTVINNGNITGDGALTLKGGLTIGYCSPSITSLYFESNNPQEYTSRNELTVENLYVKNTSLSGFTVNSVINVTGTFNDYSSKINNSENIKLSDTAVYISGDYIKEDFTVTGSFNIKEGESYTFNGNLELSSTGKLTVEDGGEIIVNGNLLLNNDGAVLNISEGGKIHINGGLSTLNTDFTCDGELTVNEDVDLRSNIYGSGTVYLAGDIDTHNYGYGLQNVSLCLIGKTPQLIEGEYANHSVNNLIVDNTSKSGVTFDSSIEYSGEFTKGDSVINNESNITKSEEVQ